MATTVATGKRNPLMHGTPPMTSGSVVIRSNVTLLTLIVWQAHWRLTGPALPMITATGGMTSATADIATAATVE